MYRDVASSIFSITVAIAIPAVSYRRVYTDVAVSAEVASSIPAASHRDVQNIAAAISVAVAIPTTLHRGVHVDADISITVAILSTLHRGVHVDADITISVAVAIPAVSYRGVTVGVFIVCYIYI